MPFLLTILAGLCSIIGYFFIYVKNDNNRMLISSLAFASGVMFYVSLFDLIPESFNLISEVYYSFFAFLLCLVFIVLGIIISSYIDRFCEKYNSDKLYHVGIVSMISLIIHNIPEGIATFLTTSYNFKLGLSMAIAIALHNIPEGIGISIPIYYSSHDKKKAFFYTFLSGISELIGAIIACMFFGITGQLFLGCLYSIIAGIMFYISLFELLPASLQYKNRILTSIFFLIGIIFIHLSVVLMK